MNSPSVPDEDPTPIVALLDRLGGTAVLESGPPPAPPAVRAASSRTKWLVAAGVVILASFLGVVAATRDRSQQVDQVVGPTTSMDTTPGSPSSAPPPEQPRAHHITVAFEPPQVATNGATTAVMTHSGSNRWPLDCQVWELSRWDGDGWQRIGGSTLWDDDGVLNVSDGSVTLDCGVDRWLYPSSIASRPLVPADTVRGRSPDDVQPSPLERGWYRLSTDGPAGGDDVVGRFEVVGPEPQLRPVEEVCAPADVAAVAAALDSPASQAVATVGGQVGEESCDLAFDEWNLTYRFEDTAPGRGPGTADPVIHTTMDRSGRMTATGSADMTATGDRVVSLSLRALSSGVATYPASDGPAVEPQVRRRVSEVLTALRGAG